MFARPGMLDVVDVLRAAGGGLDSAALAHISCAEIADEIESLRQQLETERMRLAACGVAALGYFNGCADEYKSASLEDVLRLRADFEQRAS